MPAQRPSDQFTGLDIQGGKQTGCAVMRIIVILFVRDAGFWTVPEKAPWEIARIAFSCIQW